MSRLKIKVCGMRDIENIRKISELKPDLIGFIFYPASDRYAGEVQAADIKGAVSHGITKTGVFVNADLYSIKATIMRFGLKAVQLHGNESPEMCMQLRATGVKVIKAFKMDAAVDYSKMMPYVEHCNWFLFDTKSPKHGGSGKRFDWKLLDSYDLGHPFFLSGGIGPSDADSILELNHPALYGVDVNSRFEIEPGVKDVERVARFINKLRGKKYE